MTVVVDVGAADFESVVIEGSERAPVVVDFWAPWCAPCRALTPVLEKLAHEYAGRFVLAKVNSDEHPALAARYGVRGIPNVKAFVGGTIVEEFSGALPESQVRKFLERVVPSPADELKLEALRIVRDTGDAEQALTLLERARELEPHNEDVAIERARLLSELGRHEAARSEIATLTPLARMGERVRALEARLELAAGAAQAESAAALTQRLARDEGDLDARLQLAHRHVAQGEYRPALEQLLEIVQRDRGFRDDAARKTMLKIFELMGNQGELVAEFRKRLASAMN
jgi:putative thioredoxin